MGNKKPGRAQGGPGWKQHGSDHWLKVVVNLSSLGADHVVSACGTWACEAVDLGHSSGAVMQVCMQAAGDTTPPGVHYTGRAITHITGSNSPGRCQKTGRYQPTGRRC
jgi:hypothetical protein